MQRDTAHFPVVFRSPSEQLDRAVQLAAAFIANGDIRLAQDADKNALMQDRLARLIADMYDVLDQSDEYRADKAEQTKAEDV